MSDPDLDLITEVFAEFLKDVNGPDGEPLEVMGADQLPEALVSLGLTDLNEQEVNSIAYALDEQNTGLICYEKFVEIMSMTLDSRRSDSKQGRQNDAAVKEAFLLFSKGKDVITVDDLEKISREIKDGASHDDLMDMVLLSGKSTVDIEAFAEIMHQSQAL